MSCVVRAYYIIFMVIFTMVVLKKEVKYGRIGNTLCNPYIQKGHRDWRLRYWYMHNVLLPLLYCMSSVCVLECRDVDLPTSRVTIWSLYPSLYNVHLIYRIAGFFRPVKNSFFSFSESRGRIFFHTKKNYAKFWMVGAADRSDPCTRTRNEALIFRGTWPTKPL